MSPNGFDVQHSAFPLGGIGGGVHSTQVPVTPTQDYNEILSSELDSTGGADVHNNRGNVKVGALTGELEEELSLGRLDSIPGQPEQDYPVFEVVPHTSFTCADKQFPGYFADTEARCQVCTRVTNSERLLQNA